MVAGQGQPHSGVHDRLTIDRHHGVLHAPHTEDGGLGLVDDGAEEVHRAIGTERAHREGAAADVVGEQLVLSGPSGQIADLAGDLAQRFRLASLITGTMRPSDRATATPTLMFLQTLMTSPSRVALNRGILSG